MQAVSVVTFRWHKRETSQQGYMTDVEMAAQLCSGTDIIIAPRIIKPLSVQIIFNLRLVIRICEHPLSNRNS